jgi:hypothetical protein
MEESGAGNATPVSALTGDEVVTPTTSSKRKQISNTAEGHETPTTPKRGKKAESVVSEHRYQTRHATKMSQLGQRLSFDGDEERGRNQTESEGKHMETQTPPGAVETDGGVAKPRSKFFSDLYENFQNEYIRTIMPLGNDDE